MNVDFLAITSATGRSLPPSLRPVVGFRVIKWRNDTWSGQGWHGAPPEPGGVLVLDVGATDTLPEDGYRQACRIAGDWPNVAVVGSGEGVTSVIRCLTQYREQGAA